MALKDDNLTLVVKETGRQWVPPTEGTLQVRSNNYFMYPCIYLFFYLSRYSLYKCRRSTRGILHKYMLYACAFLNPKNNSPQVTFVQVKMPPGSKELATQAGVDALLGELKLV